jgi:transposase
MRERTVRLVQEQAHEHGSQWAAIQSIATKVGCTAETLRRWVRQAERDAGRHPGLITEDQQRVKVLERENRELRRTNEILRKASAYFAQAELDRRGP